jgi:hypothetical protein
MPNFTLALAPSQLTQSINPWSWSMGDFSLFTVNLGQSSDPAFEARVLQQVGSYGRQIGRIGEALAVLLDRADLSSLSPVEQSAIDDLRRQVAEVVALKETHGSRLSAAGSPGTAAHSHPGASLRSAS